MFNFKKKKENNPENIEDILKEFRELKKNFGKLSKELEELKQRSRLAIQKVGVVRFNPFKNVGGNQSFSIALLNNKNDGVVITCLYNRESNHIYGKPIKNGKSSYLLSKEEKEAIEKAQTQR
ncbi:DUF4446 family protein [bacterium]|nr:DUF4446 family protein [bacterium]